MGWRKKRGCRGRGRMMRGRERRGCRGGRGRKGWGEGGRDGEGGSQKRKGGGVCEGRGRAGGYVERGRKKGGDGGKEWGDRSENGEGKAIGTGHRRKWNEQDGTRDLFSVLRTKILGHEFH